MKCGEIWARKARTSASTSRRRDASSSARASWPETHAATSSVARTRPAVGYGVPTTRCPTTSSSTTSGLRITCCTGQLTQVTPELGLAGDLGRLVRARERGDLVVVVGAEALPREHPLGVGQRDRRGAEQGPQVPDAPLGAGLGQALAQRRARQRRLVQGTEGRAVGLGPEVGPPEHSPERRRHARTVTARLPGNKGQVLAGTSSLGDERAPRAHQHVQAMRQAYWCTAVIRLEHARSVGAQCRSQ